VKAPHNQRVTIADVAAHAGVSKSTVSHALSGKRTISSETQARVREAIRALGFRPNPVARKLAGGERSRAIGFVFPLLAPQIAGLEMTFIASAAQVINQAEYAFVLLTHLAQSSQHLEYFGHSGLVDGFILMQVNLVDERVEFLRREGIPFVLIGRCADNTGLHFVDSAVESGIRRCVDELTALGHRELAYLYQDAPGFGYAFRAEQSFLAACCEHGLEPVREACLLTPESGETAMNRLLDRAPATTGVIVWNDAAAWGAARAAAARGRRIPGDLSLICTNHAEITRLMPFEPAFVDIRADEIATLAAEMMVALIEGRSLEQAQILVPPFFHSGASLGPKP
jgi:DNA-binding LacI/PurR family transcriptional regulator